MRQARSPQPLAVAPVWGSKGYGVGELVEQCADEGEDDDVGGCERAEVALAGDAELGDDDRELSVGDEGGAGKRSAGFADGGSPGCDPAGGELGGDGDHGDDSGGEGDIGDEVKVDLQAEEYEEDCGEEVAQRQQQPAGMRDDVALQGDAHDEGAHRR